MNEEEERLKLYHFNSYFHRLFKNKMKQFVGKYVCVKIGQNTYYGLVIQEDTDDDTKFYLKDPTVTSMRQKRHISIDQKILYIEELDSNDYLLYLENELKKIKNYYSDNRFYSERGQTLISEIQDEITRMKDG